MDVLSLCNRNRRRFAAFKATADVIGVPSSLALANLMKDLIQYHLKPIRLPASRHIDGARSPLGVPFCSNGRFFYSNDIVNVAFAANLHYQNLTRILCNSVPASNSKLRFTTVELCLILEILVDVLCRFCRAKFGCLKNLVKNRYATDFSPPNLFPSSANILRIRRFPKFICKCVININANSFAKLIELPTNNIRQHFVVTCLPH